MSELQKAQESAKIKIRDAMRTHLLHGVVNDADLTAEDTEAKVIFSLIDRCKTPEEIDDLLHILWNKIKLGFTFDEQPITKTREIFVLEKDEKLSFKHNPHTHTHTAQPTHKLILGDNFDALNNLLINYENKIDVIYIDPPYNTGGSNLGYKDRFGKHAWLNFMKARMRLAKKLLKDDGVCFVSLNDNMQAYFKILMDEIFGEENFVACLPRKTVSSGKNDEHKIGQSHDYVLIYTSLTEFARNVDYDKSAYKNKDTRGFYISRELDMSSLPYQKSLDFPVEFEGKIYYPGETIGKKGLVCWRWGKDLMSFAKSNGLLIVKNGRIHGKIYLDWEIVDGENRGTFKIVQKRMVGKTFKSNMLWISEPDLLSGGKFGNNNASKEITDIIGDIFLYPKPISLIKQLINLIPNNQKAIVLDFFAGSGTTGHAVLELNKNDGGNRQYILCTHLDYEEPNDNKGIKVCYERLYRIMNGKTTEDKKDFPWAKEHLESLGGSLDVYRLKPIDCSLLTKSKIYDEINEENYEIKFKNKQEKINWIDTRFKSLLNHLIKD